VPWDLTHADVERIAIGAGILGTGGGGNPFRGMTRAQLQLDQGNKLTIVRLDELPNDALVTPMGGTGAPLVGLEKLGRGDEGAVAVQAMQEYLGVQVAATVPIEIGGGNSFVPMIAAAQLGLPMVDADGMGRAFPKGFMISYYFDGVAPSPVIMMDAHRQKIILENIIDTRTLERVGRSITVQLGGSAMNVRAPMPMSRLRATCIPNTITLAHNVGDAVLAAQRAGANPVDAICGSTDGQVLFQGKISDVERRTEGGFNFGKLVLTGLDGCAGSTATIDLQNEFLICRVDGEIRAIVPDLITLVDSERGTPITTEVVRYGVRATVIGIPAPPQLTTEQAMTCVGPQVFGYDEPFVPLLRRGVAAAPAAG